MRARFEQIYSRRKPFSQRTHIFWLVDSMWYNLQNYAINRMKEHRTSSITSTHTHSWSLAFFCLFTLEICSRNLSTVPIDTIILVTILWKVRTMCRMWSKVWIGLTTHSIFSEFPEKSKLHQLFCQKIREPDSIFWDSRTNCCPLTLFIEEKLEIAIHVIIFSNRS